MSKLLQSLFASLLIPTGVTLVQLIDETWARQKGKPIEYQGRFLDVMRSSVPPTPWGLGLRWGGRGLQMTRPASERARVWPCLRATELSEKTGPREGPPHRRGIEGTALRAGPVRREDPQPEIVRVGDRATAVSWGQGGPGLGKPGPRTALLRGDAAGYDFPGPKPPHQLGFPPPPGAGPLHWVHRLGDLNTAGQSVVIPGYEGVQKTIDRMTGISDPPGPTPVPLRWVQGHCLQQTVPARAFFGLHLWVWAPPLRARWRGRWNLEVVWEEVPAHLGWEARGPGPLRVIEPSTPGWLDLFSGVVLRAKVFLRQPLLLPAGRGYSPAEALCHEARGVVHRQGWSGGNDARPLHTPDPGLLPRLRGNLLLSATDDVTSKAMTERSLLESARDITGENHEVRMAGPAPVGAPPRRDAALGPSLPAPAAVGHGANGPRNATGGAK